MSRLYIAAAAVLAVAAAAVALWQAGARGERGRLEAAAGAARLETIGQTKGARHAAESLDDDGLVDALGRWLLPRP